MATHLSEENQSLYDFFKAQIAEKDLRIESLERALQTSEPSAIAAEKENRIKQLEVQLQNAAVSLQGQSELQQQNANLRSQLQLSQSQNARPTKSGFGLFTLLLAALLSGVAGFVIHRFVFQPKSSGSTAFEKFKEDNLFNFEYAINQGRFDNIESTLKAQSALPENAGIGSEIEFIRKIIGAAKRKYGENKPAGAIDGFSVEPQPETINASEKPKKTIAAAEVPISIRAEANTISEKKGTLKAGQTATVWDRTNYIDKLNTTENGEKVRYEDYWYKIETAEGLEGWVFGYFTNRSLNRKFIEAPISTPPASPTAAPAGGQ